MKRLVFFSLFALCGTVPWSAGTKAPSGWEFLSTTDIGAAAFVEAHPTWDGRGVLIAVCDSGVDLDLPGLKITSDGKPKILDARVFSGEGKVDLEKALTSSDEHGTAWHGKDGKWLYGADKLPVRPQKDAEVFVGYFKEEEFKNGEGSEGDLNGNGRSDDVFGLAVFKGPDGKWLAYLDTNGDGDLSDETPSTDYLESRQVLHLRGRDIHAQPRLMAFALNLWPDEKQAALYMADNSHGTHVSGIAAGFEIEGQKGFNGVAPGAQILALKIGDNTLTGGSTTPGSMLSAWRYAAKKAAELDMPLVIQMSYGTGSENEGKGEAERLIDELLEEYPQVVATVSAGNEGPGLSSIGMPACARNVLSVAAVMNKSSAKDLYGTALAQDEIFSFSSRGGEVDKPDVAAPGFAASTVPPYEQGKNVFRGTSMASPQAAGGCALLLSAAKASGLKVRRDQVVAAVERGAVPIPGYGPQDQGSGLMNVDRSWEILHALSARDANRPARYEAECESPEMMGGKGPAIFWRGNFFPSGKPQVITVRPVFPSDASADYKAAYYEAFDLAVTADWLKVDKGSTFMKSKEPASVPVTFDAAKLKKPGLYQACLLAYAKGLSQADRERLGPEWRVPAAVVVPEDLGPSAGFSLEKRVENLRPAKLERFFVRAGPEAAALSVNFELDAGQENRSLAISLCDPEGREAKYLVLRPEKRKLSAALGPGELMPGVWEIDLHADPNNPGPASVKISARAVPLARTAPEKIHVKLAAGQAPQGEFSVFSSFPSALKGQGSGAVVGSTMDRSVAVSGASWKENFSLAPGESRLTFELSMPAEDFALFTDVALQILDSDGKALVSDGMTFKKSRLEFEPPTGAKIEAKYTLAVRGATADPAKASPAWSLRVKEQRTYSERVPLTVKQGKEDGIVLYPDHESVLVLQMKSVPPALPEGASWLAEVQLKDAEKEGLLLPLRLELTPEK